MRIAKFENNPNIVRDLDTKAVLSTDNSALQAHLRQRRQFEKIEHLENKINIVEDKLDSILELLSKSIGNNK